MTHNRSRKIRSSWVLILGVTLFATGCETIETVTPAEAIQLLNNANRPDARREGIAVLATRFDLGKQPNFIAQFQQMAQHDPDPVVRSMAIRALNLARDSASTKIFITGLQDPSELIRLESVKALANVPDTDAVPGLLNALDGSREVINEGRPTVVAEGKDVRIYAADALRRYHTLDVARSLIKYLGETDFGVAWQTRQSLIALTGQDMHYDQAAWLEFLVGPSKPFG